MPLMLMFLLLLVSNVVAADIRFVPAAEGDHYVYRPEQAAQSILVVAHGMTGNEEQASDVAYKFLKRWVRYADMHRLILIVPVFDTERFGNLSGGYGGYRNLIGKYVPADDFVNGLVDRYSAFTVSQSQKFYLYGHSAGGQFVSRYVAIHADNIIKAVISAAGRYSYPTKKASWPYGAGHFSKRVTWADGSKTLVSFDPSIKGYAAAAEVVSVVVGDKDTKKQPQRPAHIGSNRIDFSRSWAVAMNRQAKKYGYSANVAVHIVPNVGHNSAQLTPTAVRILFDH